MIDLIAYYIPKSIDEALTLAAAHHGKYVYYAGGTDIQVHQKQHLVSEKIVIDLTEIEALHSRKCNVDSLQIGSMVTLSEIITAEDICQNFPLLTKAAGTVASPIIRETATIGGNLLVKNRCNHFNNLPNGALRLDPVSGIPAVYAR